MFLATKIAMAEQLELLLLAILLKNTMPDSVTLHAKTMLMVLVQSAGAIAQQELTNAAPFVSHLTRRAASTLLKT